jgi:hypothetical protein
MTDPSPDTIYTAISCFAPVQGLIETIVPLEIIREHPSFAE